MIVWCQFILPYLRPSKGQNETELAVTDVEQWKTPSLLWDLAVLESCSTIIRMAILTFS